MKYFSTLILFVSVSVFLISCNLSQPDGEMTITTNSAEARELFLQAREKFHNVEFVAAGELLDKAIAMDPNFALAYLYRSLIVGDLNESRNYLGKALALRDQISEGEAEYILYYQALLDGNGAKQKAQLQKLEQLLPNDPYVLLQYGVYYYAFKNDYNLALPYFNKVIQIKAEYGPAYNLIGYNQIQLGNYEAAESAFKKYIEVAPTSPNPYDSYAELLLTLGKYDQSIKNYQKAFDTDNKFAIALTGIGNNFAMKGEFDKAREYFYKAHDKAGRVNDKFAALSLVISSYVEEGQLDSAVELCEQRLEMAKERDLTDYQISSMNMAAFIMRENGDLEKAQEYYDYVAALVETAEMMEADRNGYRLMVGWNKCTMLAAQNRLEEATVEATNCLKLAEQRGDPNGLQNAYGQMGRLANYKGDYQKALDNLQKADPASPYNWYQMGLAYEGQNLPDKASEWFKRVADDNELRLDLALVRQKAKNKL